MNGMNVQSAPVKFIALMKIKKKYFIYHFIDRENVLEGSRQTTTTTTKLN